MLLIVLGGPWWIWRVVLYIRKKANAPMDLELLLYGLLAAIDVLSATLVLVLLVVSNLGLVRGRGAPALLYIHKKVQVLMDLGLLLYGQLAAFDVLKRLVTVSPVTCS